MTEKGIVQFRYKEHLIKMLLCLLAFCLGLSAGQTSSPKKPIADKTAATTRITEAQKDFCGLVINCKLPMPNGYCLDTAALGKPRFSYDDARCFEARQLNARGVAPSHPRIGWRLYRFLGMEYRVIYNVQDGLPISVPRLSYLLSDLPLAAKLVSHYRKQPYTARYTDADHKSFQGEKGKNLRGEASLISGSVQEQRLFYFGVGIAEVAFWVLKGPALMDFSFGKDLKNPKIVNYTLKILVFPGNGVVNKIMNMGVFRRVVLGKIRDVLIDITATAKSMAVSEGKDVLQSANFTVDEKKRIEAFLKLP